MDFMRQVDIRCFCLSLLFIFSSPAFLFSQNISDTLMGESQEDVVITGSRMREPLLKAATSIQKATSVYFQQSASPSFFDALQNLKGVQMITPSMGFRILNTRGFANTTNVRFAQLVDGMDVQSPHIGAPIGNALGPGDLDIDEVEIVPGVAASLYGMNAINGLANIFSKNPFKHQGLSVQQKVAVSHIANASSGARLFSETALRYAKSWNNKWAVKMNFSNIMGYDWIADDYTDMNPNANISTGLTGMDNPGKDPVNIYGNESPNRRVLSLNNQNYVVARTGYREMDVTSYDLQNFKGDISVFYKPTPKSSIAYIYRGAFLDNVYQRANRFRLEDYYVSQHALQFRNESIQANIYYNHEQTGNSYNLRSMAENVDRSFKDDNTWFSDYGQAFNSAIAEGNNISAAHVQARVSADNGRPMPGSPDFFNTLSRLQQINNWDSGAALNVKAGFVQADVQWNPGTDVLKKFVDNTHLDILMGFDHRTYIVQPDGNYFINPFSGKEGQNLLYGKTGGFLSFHRNFLDNNLRIGAALRADKNDFFRLYWSPRFTAVFQLKEQHYLRASFQTGYRFPIIFEAFSNVNSGGVRRVGGLPVMSQGIFENAWLQSSISAFQSAVVRDMNVSGLSREQAMENNRNMLQRNPYGYIQPEKVNSWELGYRGLFLNRVLFIEADVYYNSYNRFIAQANMNVPNTNDADSIPVALFQRELQSRYRMWTNSTSRVYNYGFSLGLHLKLPANYQLTSNVSFARLKQGAQQDGLEDGFNTPEWILNTTLANRKIIKNFGAGLTYRWQSAFYWQSFLVNGVVASFGTVDAHTTWQPHELPLIIKLGATNIFNRYYNSFLGGPAIGGFYYASITFHPFKNTAH